MSSDTRVLNTYLQTGVFSIGFPAAHSTHESCHRLVAGVEQDADDLRPRGSSPCSHPCRYSYYHRHQTPGNNCTCPKSWCHRNTVNTKYVADRRRRTLIRLTNNFRTYRFASAGHKYDIYYIIDIMNIQSLNIYSPNRDLHLPQVTGDGLIGI